MMDTVYRVALECWLVFGQMAPYLLFGFLVAGILSVCISSRTVERHLGGSGFGPVFKAALFGVPLPLCSCGVIPVSASLRRHGASRAATTSFLLSTPQTGVDSIAVTYALLGPIFAIYRPIVALLTGFVGGALVRAFGEPETNAKSGGENIAIAAHNGAGDGRREHLLVRILKYGFQTLPRDIAAALIVGVLIAGTMSALIPPDQLKPYVGGGVAAILLLMAAGVPIYVCATASVPIAAAFVHMGASAGAALAFLITGPATNAATFTTIWKVLGKRTAVIYLGAVAFAAVVSGLTLDRFFPNALTGLSAHAEHHHTAGVAWFEHAAAVALLAILGWSYWAGRVMSKKSSDADMAAGSSESGMERMFLHVTGMNCSHCAESVSRGLREIAGVSSVEVQLASGEVSVSGQGLDRSALAKAIIGLGYGVQAAE